MAISTDSTSTRRGVRQNLPALMALALAGCLAVTTEMLPVGLLPAIGDAFDVDEQTTGLLVMVYAAMVAIFSVPLTIATRRLPRKPLILATVCAYLLSNLMIAVAPTFAFLAAGRVVGGLSHALFFSVCIGFVPLLVERGQVGRGLALVSGGATAGFVLGVPVSTTLGSLVGWRVAFAILAVFAAITLVLVARTLPAVGGAPAGRRILPPGTRTDLGVVVASNTLTFVGQYTLYTYVTVVFLTAGAHEASIGPILLLCGVCGLVGLACLGRTIDRHPRSTVLAVLGLLAAAMLGVWVTHEWLPALVLAVALWNGVFGGVPSMYQSAAVRAMPDAPEIAGAWINSTSNVGIALGAVIGGALLTTAAGTSALAWFGSALVVLGLGVAVVGTRAFPHATVSR